jgi:hypothetical protein
MRLAADGRSMALFGLQKAFFTAFPTQSRGTPQHQRTYGTHVLGTPGQFGVTIERVCEPQIWTVFRGGGIFGPLKIETSCRDRSPVQREGRRHRRSSVQRPGP